MGHRIVFAPSARRDLRGIVRYISLDSPDRAVAFGRFLLTSTKRLAEFPEMGRTVPEFDDVCIREIVARSYRVVYRVTHAERRIDIVRFWHGARGVPDLADL